MIYTFTVRLCVALLLVLLSLVVVSGYDLCSIYWYWYGYAQEANLVPHRGARLAPRTLLPRM